MNKWAKQWRNIILLYHLPRYAHPPLRLQHLIHSLFSSPSLAHSLHDFNAHKILPTSDLTVPRLLRGWTRLLPDSVLCICIFISHNFLLALSRTITIPSSTLSSHDTVSRFIMWTMQPPDIKTHLLEIVWGFCFPFTISSQHVLLS